MSEVLPRGNQGPIIGLVNLMPYSSVDKTREQWTELLDADIHIKFDDDPREASVCRSAEYLSECVSFSSVADDLDALVITGANLELAEPERTHDSRLLPLDQITYLSRLHDIIDWSVENKKIVVYSCLASHIALNYLFGLERERYDGKTFGVYGHEILAPDDELVDGIDGALVAPHSRWGDIPTKLLEDCGVEVIAVHEEIGWLLAQYENCIFLQGHPEYGMYDLAEEFQRDESKGLVVPEHYFPNDDPKAQPTFSWAENRQALFSNIKKQIQQGQA